MFKSNQVVSKANEGDTLINDGFFILSKKSITGKAYSLIFDPLWAGQSGGVQANAGWKILTPYFSC